MLKTTGQAAVVLPDNALFGRLDIFRLKDDSLDNLDSPPPPDVLAQEIVEHLEAALASFREVAAALPVSSSPGGT